MKHLMALLFSASALPAFAHGGAHIHPHDGGAWIILAGIAALIMVGTALYGLMK